MKTAIDMSDTGRELDLARLEYLVRIERVLGSTKLKIEMDLTDFDRMVSELSRSSDNSDYEQGYEDGYQLGQEDAHSGAG